MLRANTMHMRTIVPLHGHIVQVGVVGGWQALATVVDVSPEGDVRLTTAVGATCSSAQQGCTVEVDLLLAMPRPKVLRR